MSRPLPAIVMTDRERANLRPLPDYSAVQSLPELWPLAAQKFGRIVAIQDPHSQPGVQLTYAELAQQIQQFAAGLQAAGIQPAIAGEVVPPRIALFSENNARWLIADQGIMTAGAMNVVRGSQADPKELLFILADSGSIALIVEDLATLKKIKAELVDRPIQFVVLLSDEVAPAEDLKIYSFKDLMALGQGQTLRPAQHTSDTLATLMYTSGTSGMPKGVMLSHGNLLAQVRLCPTIAQPQPGEKVLSILPIWHCYERTFEYFVLSLGVTQIYTNIRYVKKDLKDFRPQYMVGVPRLWESIYEGIQKQLRDQPANKQKLVQFFLTASHHYIAARRIVQNLDLNCPDPSLWMRLLAQIKMLGLAPIHALGDKLVYKTIRAGTGGALKFVVSGGGSIAEHLEDFFEVIGIDILGGYGLTETAPITNVRRPWRNVRGADGEPVPGTEIRIVDPETRQPLPQGQKGLILIRGHQVMQGYYNNPQATAKAIDADGWFDSGDLGLVTAANDLVITGRAKDTIVLTNGENIEPQPIEDACLRSPYIDQIMLVGQDQKSLGALVVPNLEALAQWASEPGRLRDAAGSSAAPAQLEAAALLSHPAVQDCFRQELTRLVKERPGYRADDRIGPFRLLDQPFSVDNGCLTQTLKIRRNVVMDRYQGMINEMFS
jgi:long-chain acyl-CoA synthetase